MLFFMTLVPFALDYSTGQFFSVHRFKVANQYEQLPANKKGKGCHIFRAVP
jgi:hypothetical protein